MTLPGKQVELELRAVHGSPPGPMLFGSVVLLAGVVAAQALGGCPVRGRIQSVGLLIGQLGCSPVEGWGFGLRRSPERPHADLHAGRPRRER